MTEIEAVKNRHSVRKYLDREIEQQKFEIGLNEDGSVSFTDKGGIYSKTDLGIVKYHFEVGARYVKEGVDFK